MEKQFCVPILRSTTIPFTHKPSFSTQESQNTYLSNIRKNSGHYLTHIQFIGRQLPRNHSPFIPECSEMQSSRRPFTIHRPQETWRVTWTPDGTGSESLGRPRFLVGKVLSSRPWEVSFSDNKERWNSSTTVMFPYVNAGREDWYFLISDFLVWHFRRPVLHTLYDASVSPRSQRTPTVTTKILRRGDEELVPWDRVTRRQKIMCVTTILFTCQHDES